MDDIPCTVLNMRFFDRLATSEVVRESGSIKKCFDEVCGDFIISDELRKLLLLEDSDHYYVYSDEERDELLFRILKHLALGGPVNQVIVVQPVFFVDSILIFMNVHIKHFTNDVALKHAYKLTFFMNGSKSVTFGSLKKNGYSMYYQLNT